MTESVKSCVSTYLGLYVFCGQIQGRSSSDAIDYRIDDDLFDVVIFKLLVLQHSSVHSITITTIQRTTTTTFIL